MIVKLTYYRIKKRNFVQCLKKSMAKSTDIQVTVKIL